MDIIKDIVQNINSSFQLMNNETPEEIEENNELAMSMGAEDLTSIPLQQWYAPFNQIMDYRKDNSYNCLSYLKKLGYTHVIWELCESHDVMDVCDTLHGRQFTIDEILLNSQHYPPSPIFTLSHPQCFCFLKCFPPASAEAIPDDAPGLPYPYQQVTPVTNKATMKYKNQLYRKMFEVYIDAFTLLPPADSILKYSADNLDTLKKYSSGPQEVHSYVAPVIINKNINCYQPLHFVKQVEEGHIGCQIKVANGFSIVYLVKLNRLVVVPSDSLSSFTFTSGEEVETTSLEQGDFIYVDDVMAIKQYSTKKECCCFVPEWSSQVYIPHKKIIKLVK